MDEAMVTGRMDAQKKAQGGRILQRSGLNASQAINLMYDRMVEDGNANFLTECTIASSNTAWESAAEFVDSLSTPHSSRFDSMSKAQIRCERLKKRELM